MRAIRWRQTRYPDLVPRLRCDGMLAVAPYFLMAGQPELVDSSGHLPEGHPELWLLTHPDMRHLGRVKAFFDFVRSQHVLP